MFINARAIVERESETGIEILLQIRDKPTEPKAYELPGGRIEEYESIEAALYREVYEETGLKVKKIIGDTNRSVYSNSSVSIEGLNPFFVYQTLEGPVDSIGFIFRCNVAGGELSDKEEAYGHEWFKVEHLAEKLRNTPDAFDFLTPGLLEYYLNNALR